MHLDTTLRILDATGKCKMPISNPEDGNVDKGIYSLHIFSTKNYGFNYSLVEYVVREPQHLLRN